MVRPLLTAMLLVDATVATGPRIVLPEGPGLGYEPDKQVMEQYRVS